jgi:hypothetical protein
VHTRPAPVYDLAQLARLCVPIDDDFDQARLGWRPADRPARLRLVADAHGPDRDGRAALLTAMDDAIDRVEAAVRRSVDAGDPNAVALWNRTGGRERYDRRRRWWADHHDASSAARLISVAVTQLPDLLARHGGWWFTGG